MRGCICEYNSVIHKLTVLFCVCFRNIVSRFSVEQIDRIVEHILKMEDKVSGSGV